jgi:hypothetical protein
MNIIFALYLLMQKEGIVEDNQMLGAFLIEARVTSKLITQKNANEIIKNKFKNPSSLHSSFAFMLLHNRSLLVLCWHLAASFLLWPKEPFRRLHATCHRQVTQGHIGFVNRLKINALKMLADGRA